MTIQGRLQPGPRAGDVLAGKYRVERVIGTGGMGVVVAAHHVELDQRVALKFLLPEAVGTPDAVARFVREARAAVKITSEHVARVLDVGQLESGSPYIVMEYLEGSDLAAWLAERGPASTEQAVDFVLQACEAIAEAHALGMVHRNLKPANLFCTRRPNGQLSIKVLDFGISKMTTPGTPGHDMTRTNALVGSPLYMSPEQMQSSKTVDARSDIWSLGTVLFELVTGRTPFVAESVTELAIKVATEPAPTLRSRRADAPSGLEHVLAKCLEKERDRRYADLGELALALEDFGSRRARLSVERVLDTLRAAGTSGARALTASMASTPLVAGPSTAASWGQTASTPGRSGKAFLGIAVASILICGGVGVVAWRAVAERHAASTFGAGPTAVLGPPSAPAVSMGRPDADTAAPNSIADEADAAPPPTPSSPLRSVGTPWHPPIAPSGHPTARVTATAAPAPTPSCNPPYTLDDQGRKHFKPQCYLPKSTRDEETK